MPEPLDATPETVPAAPADAAFASLASAWARVDAVMRDLPLYNPALRVEVVAVRPFAGGQLGVVVSPWFMNLVLVPGAGGPPLAVGQRRIRVLRSGPLEFTGSVLDEAPAFEYRSLHSPMSAFSSQDDARRVALAALEACFAAPPTAEPGEEGAGTGTDVDRRAFLRRIVPQKR